MLRKSVEAQGASDGGTQTEYTWQDGDRALTVTLQADLVLDEERLNEGRRGSVAGRRHCEGG